MRAACALRGELSLPEAAGLLDCSLTHLAGVLRRERTPSPELAGRIATFCDVPRGRLFPHRKASA